MPPPLEVCDLVHTAVLWEWLGVGANNEGVFAEPVQLDVRWTWGRGSTVNSEGTRVAVDARVVLDREVTEDSLMWEGLLVDLSGTGSTGPQEGDGMRVASYSEGRDFKGDPRNVRREVGLVFYKGRFPPTVLPAE